MRFEIFQFCRSRQISKILWDAYIMYVESTMYSHFAKTNCHGDFAFDLLRRFQSAIVASAKGLRRGFRSDRFIKSLVRGKRIASRYSCDYMYMTVDLKNIKLFSPFWWFYSFRFIFDSLRCAVWCSFESWKNLYKKLIFKFFLNIYVSLGSRVRTNRIASPSFPDWQMKES